MRGRDTTRYSILFGSLSHSTEKKKKTGFKLVRSQVCAVRWLEVRGRCQCESCISIAKSGRADKQGSAQMNGGQRQSGECGLERRPGGLGSQRSPSHTDWVCSLTLFCGRAGGSGDGVSRRKHFLTIVCENVRAHEFDVFLVLHNTQLWTWENIYMEPHSFITMISRSHRIKLTHS